MADTEGEDLSAGSVRSVDEQGTDYRLALDKQKLAHRAAAFRVLMVCGVGLVSCFILFAVFVICAVHHGRIDALTWPLFALGSVMLLSGVTLLFGIARFTYRQEGGNGSKTDDVGADTFPPAEAISKVVELAKAIAGKSQD